jgi:hypothetical protein
MRLLLTGKTPVIVKFCLGYCYLNFFAGGVVKVFMIGLAFGSFTWVLSELGVI